MPKKILYILRHAKAEEAISGQDDHERGLSGRGVEAASAMGKYLKKEDIHPDKVLCSSAIRTVETLIKAEESYKEPLPVEYTDKLYLASAGAMLTLIAGVDEGIEKLMLVGHNPGLHQLVLKLARTGDKHLFDKLAVKFPTGSFVKLDLGDISWRNIANARAELKKFVTPKELD